LPDYEPIVERIDILKLLYPWYKDEVYRRRQQMIWLAAAAESVLLLLLCLVMMLPEARPADHVSIFFVVAGLLLFSSSMIYFIHQQRVRHEMAKGVLIRLEQALGLYEAGRYLEGAALYPENWQTAWRQDRSQVIYLGIILTLTAFVVLELLLR
jgi:hypothetical protein